MVALPMHAEQPANAQRLFELGAGLAVRPEKANATTLGAACQQVLDDPAYRRVAHGFQRRILGLPGIDAVGGRADGTDQQTPSSAARGATVIGLEFRCEKGLRTEPLGCI